MTLAAVKVKDYMSASLVTFTPEMEVLNAIHKLLQNSISGAPVVDEHGNLVGILSEKDCLKVALHAGYHEVMGGRVSEYMSPNVETVEAESSIIDVAQRFIAGDFRRFPVLAENRLVGQISRRDVLRALESLW
jgi:CBS domain-containing protein